MHQNKDFLMHVHLVFQVVHWCLAEWTQ